MRKYGKHSTGPSTYGPWVRTCSKLFSLSRFSRFVVTEPSPMKSVRTVGCHVGLIREFVGTACCTYGQSNTTNYSSILLLQWWFGYTPMYSENGKVIKFTFHASVDPFCKPSKSKVSTNDGQDLPICKSWSVIGRGRPYWLSAVTQHCWDTLRHIKYPGYLSLKMDLSNPAICCNFGCGTLSRILSSTFTVK